MRKNAPANGGWPCGTDDADGGAGPGDGRGGGDGLLGANAFERGVGTDAAGELEDGLAGFLAPGLDDVGGAELKGHFGGSGGGGGGGGGGGREEVRRAAGRGGARGVARGRGAGRGGSG